MIKGNVASSSNPKAKSANDYGKFSGLFEILNKPNLGKNKALKKVQNWFNQHANINATSIRLADEAYYLSARVLIDCANHGFLDVMQFLIEKKGFNPNQTLLEIESPLITAIKKRDEDMAIYLAQRTKNFKPLLPLGVTALHYAAKLGLLKVVSVLIKKDPSSINQQRRDGATALYLASIYNHEAVVTLLLQQGADPNISNYKGTTPVLYTLEKNMPNLLQLLLQHPGTIPFSNDFEISLVYQELLSEHKPEDIRRCLNIWFAAGGGLNVSQIPDSILAVFNLKRSHLKDFLIVCKHQEADGTFKNKIITTVEQLVAIIDDPKWRIEKAQLALACQNPALKDRPFIRKLKAYLCTNCEKIDEKTAENEVFLEVYDPLIYQQMTERELLKYYSDEFGLYDCFIKNMSYHFEMVFKTDPYLTQHHPQLFPVLKQIFKSIHSFMHLAQYPAANELQIDNKRLMQNISEMFNWLIFRIEGIARNHESLDTNLQYFIFYYDVLQKLIKFHGESIKKVEPTLYKVMLEVTALIGAKMARVHLKQGNKDVALSLTLEAMYYNDKIVIDDDWDAVDIELEKKFNHGVCLTTMAQVFTEHGWINKAGRYASQALSCLISSEKYDAQIVLLTEKLCDLFIQKNRIGKAISLLAEIISYLDKLGFLNPKTMQNVLELKSSLTNKLTTITKNQLAASLEYINSKIKPFASIGLNQDTIQIELDNNKLHPHHHQALAKFLGKNKSIIAKSATCLLLNRDVWVSKNFRNWIDQLQSLLLVEKPIAAIDEPWLTELLSVCLISEDEKEKVKKAKDAPKEDETKEETFGFKKMAGFTPIVPMVSTALPNHTLFMTMPEDNAEYAPFYKLIRNDTKTKYFSVPTVAQKGKNQHGVKLGTVTVTNDKKQREKIAYARLKAGGTARAHGYIEQSILDEKGKQRKLYVFRKIVDKKDEIRHRYKM